MRRSTRARATPAHGPAGPRRRAADARRAALPPRAGCRPGRRAGSPWPSEALRPDERHDEVDEQPDGDDQADDLRGASQPLDPEQEGGADREEHEREDDGEDVHASTVRRACEDARKDGGRASEERLKTPGRAARAAYTRSVAASPRLRGFLRLYLGAAAGVGKTYQMLGDARLAAEEGADLVIGYLEPHGRVADRGARARSRARAARALRLGRPRRERARLRLAARAPAERRDHRRAGAHECRRRRAPQALRRRRAAARQRHRRLDDGQHPAPREPQQPHPRAHRRRGARDVPRPLAARGRRDPPRRPQPALAARAHRARPRLPARSRRRRAQGLLHGREPDGAARARPARAGRGRGRRAPEPPRPERARASASWSRSAAAATPTPISSAPARASRAAATRSSTCSPSSPRTAA